MKDEARFAASIVIPAYNAAQRIGIPLKALTAQEIEDGSFEVIIVDNASTDDTAAVSLRHPAVAELVRRAMDVRVVREDRMGSNHARIRGLAEARGEFVCFLDDDNVPDPWFVATALRAFGDESVGLLVSCINADYESPPPLSILKREHRLAVNSTLGDYPITWGPEVILASTISAGMWVRRQVLWKAIFVENVRPLLDGRSGNSLYCGEDIEMGYLVGRSGFNRVYCPALRIRHVIPCSRLGTRYFCRLIIGITRSEMTLDAKYIKPHGLQARLAQVAKLAVAVIASPYLLSRRDGPREVLFVLADRWARVLGPLPCV